MRIAHQVEKVRSAEAALMAELPEGALMQRAAAGLAAVCARLLPVVYGSRVVLLVGSGDNGGDALFAGVRLARRGADVQAILAGTRTHAGGVAALRAAGGRTLAGTGAWETAIDRADLVVDGLLGIGGRGGLRDPFASLAARSAARSAAVPAARLVVACDLPSGIDASTGRVDGPAVRADVTVTFGTYKPGLLIDPGASHAGVVELVDIGLADHLGDPDVAAPRAADIAAALPRPTAESNKYRRGVVGVIAGGPSFTGAAVLCVGGAIYGGAGMVRFASAEPVVDLIRRRWPEAVTTVVDGGRLGVSDVGRVQSWVIGPGIGTGEEAERLLAAVLATDVPVLVDADGLTVMARHRDLLRRDKPTTPPPTVLTPHAGELARLMGATPEDVEAGRLEHVTAAAAELGATVLLKGSTTLVAEPGSRPVLVNTTGTPLLATAGSGDVLSGLIGALLAGGVPAPEAACAGAYLHGLAARLAGDPEGAGTAAPIAAFDLIESLPDAFRAVW